MDNGGPAFPLSRPYVTHSQYAGELEAQGMSLRDYFKAHAPDVPSNWIPLGYSGNQVIDPLMLIVWWRAEYAEAMLKAREAFKK